MSLVVADGAEQLEGWFEVFAYFADGGEIAAAVAVVGGTPDGHHVLVLKVVFVAFVDELMCACDQG